MSKFKLTPSRNFAIFVPILFLILFGILMLSSVAPFLFPTYLLYIGLAIFAFFFFSQFDFDVVSVFSRQLYIASCLFLILPLFIGTVSRGAIRWLAIGAYTIQPAEIVRPFLLVFFANYLTEGELDLRRLIKSLFLLALPAYLILKQPSLGVSILTVAGYIGVLLATNIKKKYFLVGTTALVILLPILWNMMAFYQRERILTFLDPLKDPYGRGYNSLQSVISAGSGKLFGRGLGKGVQTQLAFLPERHTDFIFAATAEELGFVGATLLILGFSYLFSQLIGFIEKAPLYSRERVFLSGLFVSLLVQTFIHMGMNLGMLPISGIPLPLVSAGGSSLLATMIALGIANGIQKS